MTRETRKVVSVCDTRERYQALGIQRTRAAHVDVQAGIRCCRLDIEGLADRLERLGNGPGRANGAIQARRQNRACVDRHDMVRARRREAGVHNVAAPNAGMQDSAAAPRAMSVNEVTDRSYHIGLCQGFYHERALPKVVLRKCQVLQRAAAADAEMLANRFAAFMA